MQLRHRPSTSRQVQAALLRAAPTPTRTARCWLFHWLAIEPTTKRYQDPVCLARVLSEHHAAIAAEPLDCSTYPTNGETE